MSKSPSWHEVADILGARMEHQQFCEAHPEPEADPDHCPFCAGRAAYRVYQAKAGIVPKSESAGQTVSVFDLRRAAQVRETSGPVVPSVKVGDLVDVPAGADVVCTTRYRVRVDHVGASGVAGPRERADGKLMQNRHGDPVVRFIPWNVLAKSAVITSA